MRNISEQATGIGENSSALVQMPMRCSSDLQERIIRALGETMSKTGKKVSKNEFLIHLLELGLLQIDRKS